MRRKGRALRRRYGRAHVRAFTVAVGPLGPKATAYDTRSHVVGFIQGSPYDHSNVVRRDARAKWPGAEEW